MRIQALIDKYGSEGYKKLHEISRLKSYEDILTGYADMGDHAIVVGVTSHALRRLSGRFGISDGRCLLEWFISNLEESGNGLREAVKVISARNYEKMGLYTDKVAYGDMFMYVYFYTGYIEISTVVDFLTARDGIYYCDPEACPVWLQKSGRAVPGFSNIPKLAKSSCRKYRHAAV